MTIKFTIPEALTEWRFLGFAHDSQMRSGSFSDTAVTSKDLMVEPLAPRFVREGDVLEFTVKVTNQSPTQQTGTVRLTLADASTLESVDDQLENTDTDRTFAIPSQQSESFSWRLHIPDGMGFLTYKAVGSTGRLSDGEEGYLPVLSRRILVTESLPLPIRGAGPRQFEFRSCSSRPIGLAAKPVSDRTDGFSTGLVRGDGTPVPHGIPPRMHGAGLQSALCQRPGTAHRQLRSQDPPDF